MLYGKKSFLIIFSFSRYSIGTVYIFLYKSGEYILQIRELLFVLNTWSTTFFPYWNSNCFCIIPRVNLKQQMPTKKINCEFLRSNILPNIYFNMIAKVFNSKTGRNDIIECLDNRISVTMFKIWNKIKFQGSSIGAAHTTDASATKPVSVYNFKNNKQRNT